RSRPLLLIVSMFLLWQMTGQSLSSSGGLNFTLGKLSGSLAQSANRLSGGKNMRLKPLTLFVASLCVVAAAAVQAQVVPRMKMTTDIPLSITTPDSMQTRLGTLNFRDGFPDDATVQKVYDNLDFQRGVQAFLTAMPAASLFAMRDGFRSTGATD